MSINCQFSALKSTLRTLIRFHFVCFIMHCHIYHQVRAKRSNTYSTRERDAQHIYYFFYIHKKRKKLSACRMLRVTSEHLRLHIICAEIFLVYYAEDGAFAKKKIFFERMKNWVNHFSHIFSSIHVPQLRTDDIIFN